MFWWVYKPLQYLFDMSLRKGEMPCSIKIARVTPLLKVDDLKNVTYYRPISVFPLIMYNHLYKYLIDEKKNSVSILETQQTMQLLN